MNRRHFNTAKKKANIITHYACRDFTRSLSGELVVMAASEFVIKGGLTKSWGKRWRAVRSAADDDHAKELARGLV